MIRNFLISTVGIAIVFYILPSVNLITPSVTGVLLLDKAIGIVVIAVILAALNMTVKPLMKIVAFPINVVTLGLFSIIINTVVIIILDKLSNSFEITGFVNYLIFSILLSIVNIGLSVFKDNE